ncbi:MAG TPA: APC family permease [Woeseiaceae bacterium]|nr:APC family permease [Woeseiaceae bacterium]
MSDEAAKSVTSASSLVRGIGRWDLTAILVNSVIGAGILGLPAIAFGLVGSYSLGAWALCSIIVGLIALCFAEVGSRFSTTGGPYLYTYAAFGPATGFIVGWLSWVSRLFSLAAIGNLAVNYAGAFSPALTRGAPRVVVMTATFAVLVAILLTGVRRSALVNNILTACKLLVLFGFVLLGLFFIDPTQIRVPPPPALDDWQTVLLLMTFAFIGFESATINAGEMRNPGRDVPFALGAGLAAIALLYLLIQFVCIATMPALASSERPVVDAMFIMLGPVGAGVINAGALIMMLGTLFAVLLTGSRLPFALAEQQQLPAFLCSVDKRYKVPRAAILITAVLAWLLMLYTSFIGALTATALTRLIGYVTTCAALIALRARKRAAVGHANDEPANIGRASFKVPGGPVVAVLAILACLWLMSGASTEELSSLLVTTAIGAILGGIYALARRRKRRP